MAFPPSTFTFVDVFTGVKWVNGFLFESFGSLLAVVGDEQPNEIRLLAPDTVAPFMTNTKAPVMERLYNRICEHRQIDFTEMLLAVLRNREWTVLETEFIQLFAGLLPATKIYVAKSHDKVGIWQCLIAVKDFFAELQSVYLTLPSALLTVWPVVYEIENWLVATEEKISMDLLRSHFDCLKGDWCPDQVRTSFSLIKKYVKADFCGLEMYLNWSDGLRTTDGQAYIQSSKECLFSLINLRSLRGAGRHFLEMLSQHQVFGESVLFECFTRLQPHFDFLKADIRVPLMMHLYSPAKPAGPIPTTVLVERLLPDREACTLFYETIEVSICNKLISESLQDRKLLELSGASPVLDERFCELYYLSIMTEHNREVFAHLLRHEPVLGRLSEDMKGLRTLHRVMLGVRLVWVLRSLCREFPLVVVREVYEQYFS